MTKFPGRAWTRATLLSSALALAVTAAFAQTSAVDEIAKYRAALQDGNPAELWEARGEGLWKQPAGPNKVSLEKCDLGLGPGVVKGAYAQLPRYFADADRVMDLETRLVWCRMQLQGLSEADAKKNPFGNPGIKSDNEALVAYVTSESRGIKMNVAGTHPKEQEMYRAGREDVLLPRRPARLRVRDLPRRGRQAHPAAGPAEPAQDKEGAQKAYTTWPAYRVSQGELRTFQWRLNDCFRQQRFPELVFTSDASIALTMFLAKNANGAAFDAPAIKR